MVKYIVVSITLSAAFCLFKEGDACFLIQCVTANICNRFSPYIKKLLERVSFKFQTLATSNKHTVYFMSEFW